jgi:hypothetical protein
MEIIDVTLSPTDRDSGTVISADRLSIVRVSKYGGIRATHGKTAGKWYWEVEFKSGETATHIGVATKNVSLSSWDTTEKTRVIYGRGYIFPDNISYNYTWKPKDIIGFALNLDDFIIEYYINGLRVLKSSYSLKNMGEVFPYFASSNDGTKEYTFNFGKTPFKYEIPRGFYSYDGSQRYPDKILLSFNSKTYSLTPPIYATETAIPQMTSNTTPSGRAFANSENSSNNGAWRAFDDTTSNYASGSNYNNGYIGYEFIMNTLISKYIITGAATNTNPKDWTFEGSNDGANWFVIDTQVNQVWTSANAEKEYIIDSSKVNSYKMYRLNWTANNGSTSTTALNKLKMYEYTPPKLLNLPNQSEQTFINHGMESPINITQLSGAKLIESNSTTHESGKKYTHTVDLSKRRVYKIILS